MINKKVVRKALKRSWDADIHSRGRRNHHPGYGKDRITALLMYDIFGGEILRTFKKNGWHFYNRIEGIRIDFTNVIKTKFSDDNNPDEITSSVEETYQTFEEEEYLSLSNRFIRAYENAIGLKKYPVYF